MKQVQRSIHSAGEDISSCRRRRLQLQQNDVNAVEGSIAERLSWLAAPVQTSGGGPQATGEGSWQRKLVRRQQLFAKFRHFLLLEESWEPPVVVDSRKTDRR